MVQPRGGDQRWTFHGSHGRPVIEDQERCGSRCLSWRPAAELLSCGKKAVNARTPRRGGLLSGPAAAVDEYEDAPHDAMRVRREPRPRHQNQVNCSGCEIATATVTDSNHECPAGAAPHRLARL